MASLKHIHQYQRVSREKKHLYRCVHPDCSHYNRRELLINKRARCVCGNDFILDLKNLNLKNPHCEACGKNYEKKIAEAEIAAKILKERLGTEIVVQQEIRPEELRPEDFE